MNSESNIATEVAALPTNVRPTPEEIDTLIKQYLDFKQQEDYFSSRAEDVELDMRSLVERWGEVLPKAEKTRIVKGRFGEIKVTKSDSIAIDAARVEQLRDVLEVNGHGQFFSKLFAQKPVTYEIVDGAESALKQVVFSRRLSEKILSFFGRCITVKPKKPSLKVSISDPAKPAKKRTKKGGQA